MATSTLFAALCVFCPCTPALYESLLNRIETVSFYILQSKERKISSSCISFNGPVKKERKQECTSVDYHNSSTE